MDATIRFHAVFYGSLSLSLSRTLSLSPSLCVFVSMCYLFFLDLGAKAPRDIPLGSRWHEEQRQVLVAVNSNLISPAEGAAKLRESDEFEVASGARHVHWPVDEVATNVFEVHAKDDVRAMKPPLPTPPAFKFNQFR